MTIPSKIVNSYRRLHIIDTHRVRDYFGYQEQGRYWITDPMFRYNDAPEITHGTLENIMKDLEDEESKAYFLSIDASSRYDGSFAGSGITKEMMSTFISALKTVRDDCYLVCSFIVDDVMDAYNESFTLTEFVEEFRRNKSMVNFEEGKFILPNDIVCGIDECQAGWWAVQFKDRSTPDNYSTYPSSTAIPSENDIAPLNFPSDSNDFVFWISPTGDLIETPGSVFLPRTPPQKISMDVFLTFIPNREYLRVWYQGHTGEQLVQGNLISFDSNSMTLDSHVYTTHDVVSFDKVRQIEFGDTCPRIPAAVQQSDLRYLGLSHGWYRGNDPV